MKKMILSMILSAGLILCGCSTNNVLSTVGEEIKQENVNEKDEEISSEPLEEENGIETSNNNYQYNPNNPNGVTGDAGNAIDDLKNGSFLPSGYTFENLLYEGRYEILENYDNGSMISVTIEDYNGSPNPIVYYVFINCDDEFFLEKICYTYDNGESDIIEDEESLNNELVNLFENFENSIGGN